MQVDPAVPEERGTGRNRGAVTLRAAGTAVLLPCYRKASLGRNWPRSGPSRRLRDVAVRPGVDDLIGDSGR